MEQAIASPNSLEHSIFTKLSQGHNSQKVRNHYSVFVESPYVSQVQHQHTTQLKQSNSHSQNKQGQHNSQHSQKSHLHLITYFTNAIEKNIDKTKLFSALINLGWDKRDLDVAYEFALHVHAQKKSPVSESSELSGIAQAQAKLAELLETQETIRAQLDNAGKEKIRSHLHKHFFSEAKQKAKSRPKEEPKKKKIAFSDDEDLVLAEQRALKKLLQTFAQNSRPPPAQAAPQVMYQPAPQTIAQQQNPQQFVQSDESQQVINKNSKELDSKHIKEIEHVSEETSSYQRPTDLNVNAASVNVSSIQNEGGGMGLYNLREAESIHYTDEADEARVTIGVPDLDRVISGGLKKYSTTLISGGAGTGKSTFALQYLVNGIIAHNQPGIYITFEQTQQAVIDLGHQFGWDLENLIKQGMLIVHEYTPEQVAKALEVGGGSMRDMIDSIGAKRIVFDSITEYKMLFHSEIAQRKGLTELFKNMAKWKCTALLVGQEHSETGAHVSSVLDYECDAVILLYNERKGDVRFRSLEIYKMRETKHAGRIFPMRITNNGIIINTEDLQLVRG